MKKKKKSKTVEVKMIEISNGWMLFSGVDSAEKKTRPKLLCLADYIFFDVRPAPPTPGNVPPGCDRGIFSAISLL